MPLTLLSSRLRHSLGSKTKANGCWKLLLLGVPHLERYHSFQWTLLFVPMCWVGILFLFFYLSLFTPISASVLNSPYPFNDLFLHHPQSMRQEPPWTIFNSSVDRRTSNFSKSLQRLPWMFPFSLPQCEQSPPPFLCGKDSVASPLTCAPGKLDFLLFACSEQKRSIFSEKPCSKNNFRVLNSKKPLQQCWA